MEDLASITAKLARQQINILDVKYEDGDIEGIEFEYGWRVTPTSIKWTRAFYEVQRHDAQASLRYAYRELLEFVDSVRGNLEG